MTTARKRVLPADVYDALELSALAFGGIGAGRYFDDHDWDNRAPRCAIGHYAWVRDSDALADVEREIKDMGINIEVNDNAVEAINERLERQSGMRVSFADWCAELGVVRGES